MTGLQFRNLVYAHTTAYPRDIEMPWRVDYNPYYVLLSEIMLQQTQVSRVVEYFNKFVVLWSDIREMSKARLSDVLFHWQGLGYNRRGKFLHMCAREIVEQHNGTIPCSYEELKSLPGIGDYTASAIMVFAYNEPFMVLETNIRRAIIYHFFKDMNAISDNIIREKVEYVLDKENPRVWYWALMDYGAYLSKIVENPNRRSKIYRTQDKFEGSTRQLRGTILRVLLNKNERLDKSSLIECVYRDIELSSIKNVLLSNQYDGVIKSKSIEIIIEELQSEGLVVAEGDMFYIP